MYTGAVLCRAGIQEQVSKQAERTNAQPLPEIVSGNLAESDYDSSEEAVNQGAVDSEDGVICAYLSSILSVH
jgi:hypothetical protein